ncbi:30S ribosomal S21 2 domain protein [Burkholderia oklahomensis]|uniref:30S ribosomal S21 2 domain protein n=1 Tax=Burkholderia oklahomensis TaxID=342113 RepID=A0AAI8BB88_9BURK|nr:30S ribosomal S21 2 domain protein [Burkholderia oklahomensis]
MKSPPPSASGRRPPPSRDCASKFADRCRRRRCIEHRRPGQAGAGAPPGASRSKRVHSRAGRAIGVTATPPRNGLGPGDIVRIRAIATRRSCVVRYDAPTVFRSPLATSRHSCNGRAARDDFRHAPHALGWSMSKPSTAHSPLIGHARRRASHAAIDVRTQCAAPAILDARRTHVSASLPLNIRRSCTRAPTSAISHARAIPMHRRVNAVSPERQRSSCAPAFRQRQPADSQICSHERQSEEIAPGSGSNRTARACCN